ncbi:MAG: aldehyde dehydrogenase family protein [bacterium]|nr:aldehyde dehydrogenase family protein [bacterium]MDE0289498.1 aldehyde dehydrogenase family protein [bacterium]MDE0438474.1 aldehyde dehydrogenase family protein [bacterium]
MTTRVTKATDAEAVVKLVARARSAMAKFNDSDQQRVDEVVTALAWSLYKPEHARELAELAVRTTGLGNVEDKIVKNRRKTFGTLRDLSRARTVGLMEEDRSRGLMIYAKPVGVVAAVTPSTNPAATPVNKAMMAVKGRNAVIVAPSPLAYSTTSRAIELMRAALETVGAPKDLVLVLPAPVTRAATTALMEACDLSVVTGSQNNVRTAYRSGKPAIGVGAGNVPVIVDNTADLRQAAVGVMASKTFDNATSCSSENSLVILDDVYDRAMDELRKVGAYVVDEREKRAIRDALWVDGKLNRDMIAQDADVLARRAGLGANAEEARLFLVEDRLPAEAGSFADEKLSLVLTVYRAARFREAIDTVRAVLAVRGRGHSCGVYTASMDNARLLATELDVVRVLVNQAHAIGNGGSFTNGLPFTLTMGCGTWAGNSISENLNYRHFINLTHLSTTIPEDRPSEEALFGDHWRRYGA